MSGAITLTIDPEFRDLCPSLSDDEKNLLRDSLCTEGCRDPIVAWDAPGHPVIDGHHRHGICTDEDIPFKTHLLKFDDRRAVKCWILRNQLGRRNLTDAQRSIARGRLYNELRAENHQNMPQNPGSSFCTTGDTATAVAAQDGVSASTVKRDGQFAEAADAVIAKVPALKDDIERGVIPRSTIAALAEAPKSALTRIAKTIPTERKAAAKALANACPNCGAIERDEDGDCAKCHEPAASMGGKPNGKPPTPSKNGKPVVDVRLFKKFEQQVGAVIRLNTEVKNHCGGADHHAVIRDHLNDVLKEITSWRKSAKAS
jgi:hypothetical protein